MKIWFTTSEGTRFATWFYTMHRVLCQPSLKFTFDNPLFGSLSKNNHDEAAIKDIDNEVFWMTVYSLIFTVFSAFEDHCSLLPLHHLSHNQFCDMCPIPLEDLLIIS